MTFLPIVERELRVAARRKATTWTRFFAALTALVVGGVLLTANQRHLSAPYVGQQLFMAVSILAFGFALLAGIFLTADCLCSERRDGTLGLLFLTDLRHLLAGRAGVRPTRARVLAAPPLVATGAGRESLPRPHNRGPLPRHPSGAENPRRHQSV